MTSFPMIQAPKTGSGKKGEQYAAPGATCVWRFANDFVVAQFPGAKPAGSSTKKAKNPVS